MSRLKTVFLFGPTGSGKTEALEKWYKKLPELEVISADSMQVYRGLNIGTAKAINPACPPCHLLDIRKPQEQFNLADFVRLAGEAIREIGARGHIPVVSGGTAFYFKHLWFGMPQSPPQNPEIRARLEARCADEGLESLRRELEQVDPEANRRIQANDAYRVLRALEVYETGGRPLSSYHLPDTPLPDRQVLAFGIERRRDELYERINNRVERMFEAGLVNEIRELIAGGCGPQDPAMKAIGYREFFQDDVRSHLYSNDPLPEKLQKELITRIQQASRNYAKRQINFFSKLPNVRWVNFDNLPGCVSEIEGFFCRY